MLDENVNEWNKQIKNIQKEKSQNDKVIRERESGGKKVITNGKLHTTLGLNGGFTCFFFNFIQS